MIQDNRKQLGNFGEQLCVDWLEKKRWEVLAQNWRYQRLGEIDLIAFDPQTKTLHIIEVKTRRSHQFSHPAEAIDERKQQKIIHLAEQYLITQAEKLPEFENISFDALLITCSNTEQPEKAKIEWLENAFQNDT